jgi:ABC-type nitrate/sulfonate/bicarbonate transport system ATPase subunit
MSTIKLKQVSKQFQRPDGTVLQVLDNINFSISDQSFNAILGPSGCGKSTILNLVAGLDPCSSGTITINDQKMGQGSARPRIGFVFQRPRLLNWRTVLDNILLPLESDRRSRQTRLELADRYLQLVGLDGFADYYPLQLSGGMQQRVAIARALVIDPDILLMDEPFSGLDELTARKMRKELIRIWQQAKQTIIFVTHSISEAVFLSQQVLIVSSKPATVFKTIHIDQPYPRQYGDLKLFEIETELTNDFLGMDLV